MDNKQQIQELREQKRNLTVLANEYYELHKKTLRELSNINKRLETECEHTWIRERACYGEQTDYICQHCGLSN